MPELLTAVLLTAVAMVSGFVAASVCARRRERAAWALLAEVCADLRAVRAALERTPAAAPPAVPESLDKIEGLESEVESRGNLKTEPATREGG